MKLVSERLPVVLPTPRRVEALIVWDNFENAARTQARVQDVVDLALVVIPHRKGGETADDQRRKAEQALPAVVAGLIRQEERA